MNTERLTITDDVTEKLEIAYDGERFALIHTDKMRDGKRVVILNPREARRIARLINRSIVYGKEGSND